MDQQEQQRRVNEAAEQFADAVRASFQAVSERGTSAQALNAELTQQFFNTVIGNLRSQAEENRQMTQQLADQQQRGAEAAQTFTRESVDAYMEFANSMFLSWQVGAQAAERGAGQAAQQAGGEGGRQGGGSQGGEGG